MHTIRVSTTRRVIEQFKKAAKLAFPCETFAYLIGHNAGSVVAVEGLYFPEDVAAHCTDSAVAINEAWMADAMEHAEESEAFVVGDIHSHPRRFTEWRGQVSERTPSEGDHAAGWPGLCGICVVSEQWDGRLRASVRFYGPSYRIETRINVRGN